jgi:hypothetical protein
MFRCAAPGLLADLFKQAGLNNVSEREMTGKINYGSSHTYWSFMNDVVAPVVAAMSKADDNTKEEIKAEVFDLIDQKYPDKKFLIDYGSLILCGEK